ncbi:hypothetical protein FRC17_005221 [Serendipita sp. 399]|nr:hypothetical protein FRC17_005221 [Serendipita sp. 399]
MAFFGFETSVPRAPDISSKQAFAEEDIAVYTWGDVSYDALGDALEETGDDLNDETFGGGPVGKDFDFTASTDAIIRQDPPLPPLLHTANQPTNKQQEYANKTANDRWNSKDPTLALPRHGSLSQASDHTHQRPLVEPTTSSVFARLDGPKAEARQTHHLPSHHSTHSNGGVEGKARTMAEIEAEMHAFVRQQQQEQLLAQQKEKERIQAEQTFLLQQRLIEEERLRLEREHETRQLYEQQAFQDPLRAIRAMMDGNGLVATTSHQKRLSGPISISPTLQIRQPMQHSVSLQSSQLGDVPTSQQTLLQELLYREQQQRQQLLEQQLQSQQQQQQRALNMEQQEAVIADARRRIQEAEIMEVKQRRRMSKIQSMSRYNDLMTQSDKDFITRVQVAQLVTSDPYADDFYAQVYASIRQQRIASENEVLRQGTSTRSGGGGGRGPHRRENAIQRLQAQVERMVTNMKNREQTKDSNTTHGPLQNVLGKTSGRSYKAAPRQLLQLATASPESQKAHPVKEHEMKAADHGNELPPPFTHAEGLMLIERLFTNILEIEQLRRNRPPIEDEEAVEAWKRKVNDLLDTIWKGLRVSGPLYETNPHPFIALITPMKGKRFVGRLGRDLADDQKLMTLSVIVNRIEQVDVIRNAAILDSIEDSQDRRMVEKQAHAFQEFVINQGLQLSPMSRTLKTYSALIEMMIENIATFARVVTTRAWAHVQKPGLTLLEHFFAEASLLKHGVPGPDGEMVVTAADDVARWANLYDRLFEHLLPLWNIMFPSTRVLSALPPDSMEALQVSLVTDGYDLHVWRFLAGFALEGTLEQHSRLVTQLRAKVMGTLVMARRMEEGKAKARKIRNVDLFLNALGLSSSQLLGIPVQ